MGKPKVCLLVLGLVLFANSSFAEGSAKKKQSELDFGIWVSNVSQRLDAPDGFASKVSGIQGALRYRLGIAVKKWRFEPAVMILLPWRSGADGGTKAYTSHFGLNGVFSLGKRMNVRLGTGVQWEMLSASAQTLELDNGGGTSDFYIPARTTHTFLLTVQTGLSFALGNRWTLGTEAVIGGLLNSDKRRIHALVTMGVKL